MVSYTGAYGGEVGRMVGFSRRVRYSAQGSAPFGKMQSDFKSIFLFTELFLKITVLEMLPQEGEKMGPGFHCLFYFQNNASSESQAPIITFF